MSHFRISIRELIVESIGNHHGRVRSVVGHIAEEGAFFVRFDKGDGSIGEVIHDVAIAADFLAVVIERWAEVVSPVSRSEAVVFIEAAVVGMIRRLGPIVPFTEGSSDVAICLEGVGDGRFVGI